MKQPLINKYDFGVIVIDNNEYHRDLIVTPSRVITNWWRIEGHRLQLDDVKDVLNEDVDAVVIGTGYRGYLKVEEEVLNEFKKRGIEIHMLKSREAVVKYNELVEKGLRVLLLIHLTC